MQSIPLMPVDLSLCCRSIPLLSPDCYLFAVDVIDLLLLALL
jgi:hypothetical protein